MRGDCGVVKRAIQGCIRMMAGCRIKMLAGYRIKMLAGYRQGFLVGAAPPR